ncbi:hypothetical protein HDU93_000158 [Gonapodya sp. JEL0774]|nr:hypothetical protein HDU93_000158 [Gonapodya sp. JEL0774]
MYQTQPQNQLYQQQFQQPQQQQPTPAFAVNASAWTTAGHSSLAGTPQPSFGQGSGGGSPAMPRMAGAGGAQKETSTGIGRPAYRWALSGQQQMQPWVPPMQILYQEAGVTIAGTFARRDGRMLLELIIQNQTSQGMRDLSVSFGRNTFTLGPATPKLSVMGVPQGGQVEASVQLRASIPIHVLFTEQGLIDQTRWLKLWTESGASEWACPLQGMRFESVDELRGRLGVNNVFVVAQRIVNGMHYFYVSMALPNHPATIFVAEISLDEQLANGKLSVKIPGKTTEEAGELAGPVFESVGRMMLGQ